ncbi:MAG: flagellar hook-basal body complex protein FliE [Thermohalobaculum sp.]|nr:flagellar hook-basal body complex protein FliE [Thermohalobaculum sp.]
MTFDTSLALQSYGNAKKFANVGGAEGGEEGRGGPSFSDALSEAARMMETSLRQAEVATVDAASGKGDVQTLVEALSTTEMALETAVTVRDRVVEAYQEILRMPV